ncbi:unnamed protein product, partial [Prorocentrum cordatum]
QAANCRYFYLEQDVNSRALEDTLISQLKRLPEILSDNAYIKDRACLSNLPGSSLDFEKMVSQVVASGPFQTELGDIPEPLRGQADRLADAVQEVHENMGHCSNESLAMALKYGKGWQVPIEAAQHLARPSCVDRKRPRLAMPSKAPPTYQFGDVIGAGIFFVFGPENTAK